MAFMPLRAAIRPRCRQPCLSTKVCGWTNPGAMQQGQDMPTVCNANESLQLAGRLLFHDRKLEPRSDAGR